MKLVNKRQNIKKTVIKLSWLKKYKILINEVMTLIQGTILPLLRTSNVKKELVSSQSFVHPL